MSEQRKNRKRGILLAGVLILAIAALAALYFWITLWQAHEPKPGARLI
mgnify:CR=1 FL=1